MRRILLITLSILLIPSAMAKGGNKDIVYSNDFATALSNTPASIIDGQFAGVRVSSTEGSSNGIKNINIRGINSVFGSGDPLWIIDGVIMNPSTALHSDAFWQYGGQIYTSPLNNLGSLNVYDIESIEVLKDMSATAMYGNKGANGVIVIKTRRPNSAKNEFRLNSNVGVSIPQETAGIYRPSVSHNHSLSFGKAVSGTFLNVSAFFRGLNDAIPSDKSNYGGLSVKFETQANSVIWFGVNSKVSLGKMSNTNTTAYFGYPSITMLSRFPDKFEGDTIDGWKLDMDDDTNEYRCLTDMYLRINFSKFFYAKLSGGIDFQKFERGIWYGNGTSFGKSVNGAAASITSELFSYNGDLLLEYDRYFASDHHLTATLDAFAAGTRSSFNTMNGTDFFTHTLRAQGLSIMGDKALLHSFRHNYVSFAVALKLHYDFARTVGIDIAGRADFTPKYFDARPFIYPSANVWFDIRQLAFADSKVFSALKLTAGYGISGRENYLPYELAGYYVTSGLPELESGSEPYFDGLDRITSKEANIGLNIGFLDNRLTASAKYYRKSTNDTFSIFQFGTHGKIYWASAPRTEFLSKSADVANNGIEFTVGGIPVQNNDMRFCIDFNGAYNFNQITSISPDDFKGLAVGNGQFFNTNILGSQVGSLLGYKTNQAGEAVDMTRDDVINDYDKVILGNTIPVFHGALNMSFSFKQFSAAFLADGACGFSIANLNRMFGDEAKFLTSKYVESGDYLQLKRVSFGYDIPLKKRKVVKSLKIILEAENLATLTKYSGYNPDVNCYGTSVLSAGLDYGSMPRMRSVILGVSVKF